MKNNYNMPDDFEEFEIEFYEKFRDVFEQEEGLIDYPDVPFSEILKRAEAMEQQEKGRKYPKFKKIAAIILIVFLASSAMTIWINSDPAFAGNLSLVKLLHKIGLGGLSTADQSEIIDSNNTIIVTKNEDLEKGKAFLPDLLIPDYIPNGYFFKVLEIKVNENHSFIYTYLYESSEDQLFIDCTGNISAENMSLYIEGFEHYHDPDGNVYITTYPFEQKKIFRLINESAVFSIHTSSNILPDEELVHILNNMN